MPSPPPNPGPISLAAAAAHPKEVLKNYYKKWMVLTNTMRSRLAVLGEGYPARSETQGRNRQPIKPISFARGSDLVPLNAAHRKALRSREGHPIERDHRGGTATSQLSA